MDLAGRPELLTGDTVGQVALALALSPDGASSWTGQILIGVAADPRSDTIYVTNEGSGTMSVISGGTDTVTATIRVGRSPYGSRPTRGPAPSTSPSCTAAQSR